MRIQALSVIAGAAVLAHVGDVVDVDDEQGAELIAGGYAVAVETATAAPAQITPADGSSVETATVVPDETR